MIDGFDYGALLDKFTFANVWMDYCPSGQGNCQHGIDSTWLNSSANKDSLFLSSSTDWYGLCSLAIYDFIGLFKCGKDGLDLGRSSQGLGGF